MTEEVLLKVVDLKKHFPVRGGIFSKIIGYIKAVDGISFNIIEGETLGLVGESGCGKTTTGRAIIRLTEPTSGRVIIDGKNLSEIGKDELRKARRRMQIIFQDPYGSLNPRMTISSIIGEPFLIHNIEKNKKNLYDRIENLLKTVGLDANYMQRYPHEFSGGQRQRIGIARALALNPKLIICDEPVSALDVSIQAQVINLLEELQKEFSLTYLFIAHDLSVVKHISDRVAVMYLGKIIELADVAELYNYPMHPYTKALISAIPIADPTKRERKRILLEGDVASPFNMPEGCRFYSRCKDRQDVCCKMEPELKNIGNNHYVACHLIG